MPKKIPFRSYHMVRAGFAKTRVRHEATVAHVLYRSLVTLDTVAKETGATPGQVAIRFPNRFGRLPRVIRMTFNCPLLETRGLTAFYGDFQALYSIDFRIELNETWRSSVRMELVNRPF